MSLQLVWPVELFTAARVCPRTQNHWSGGVHQTRTVLLVSVLALGMRDSLSTPKVRQGSRVGSEAGRQDPQQDKRRDDLQNLGPDNFLSHCWVNVPLPLTPVSTHEKGHLYFLNGSWINMCLFSLSLRLNADSHTEHL